ncbi:fluoride efflux transporter CrcB [soil metagenome]
MTTLLLVAAGSGLGGAARYMLGTAVARHLGAGFPWGTFVVNLSGCFLIGLLFGALGSGPMLQHAPPLEQAAAFGFLGGYTTFSTYSIEAVSLYREGALVAAAVYVFGTFLACIAALLLGVVCVR